MKKLLIIFCLLASLLFTSCSKDTTKTVEEVSEGYERFELTNAQVMKNGLSVYILTDTALNVDYMYVVKDGNSTLYFIGEHVDPNEVNEATQELIEKNAMCNWAAYTPGGDLAK